MVFILKKGATKKEMELIHKKLDMGRKKGVNILKYCGVLKLKRGALTIQKAMRKEW